MDRILDMEEIIGALIHLERRFGRSPSVEEIAEQANCAPATALKYLREAVGAKRIVQSDKGKYMSLEVARAYKRDE